MKNMADIQLNLSVEVFKSFQAAVGDWEKTCPNHCVYIMRDTGLFKVTRDCGCDSLGYIMLPCGLPDEIKFVRVG